MTCCSYSEKKVTKNKRNKNEAIKIGRMEETGKRGRTIQEKQMKKKKMIAEEEKRKKISAIIKKK